MPTIEIDGIETRYETAGSGPAILMYSPGGFDSSLDNWRTFNNWARLNLLDHLKERYTYVAFDRRESGESGGRLERITWADYVRQGAGLLDHLGIEQAHLMGGCVGCSSISAFAVAHPERVLSLVLYQPAGGPLYRIKQMARVTEHLAFATEHGLSAVVERALSHDKGFVADPKVGPWVTVLRRDRAFAERYAAFDQDRYLIIVARLFERMFDRDTVSGAEPEDLMQLTVPALIVPGEDTSHAPSAARYLQECLPHAEYWELPVAQQTEQNVPARVMGFLDGVSQQKD